MLNAPHNFFVVQTDLKACSTLGHDTLEPRDISADRRQRRVVLGQCLDARIRDLHAILQVQCRQRRAVLSQCLDARIRDLRANGQVQRRQRQAVLGQCLDAHIRDIRTTHQI